jgi:colanic acid/amylovoran biosynthesis glycosyltransferase
MLAIATTHLNAPSETFIRDHIRTIAPGETVLICSASVEEAFGCRVLGGIPLRDKAPVQLGERVALALRRRCGFPHVTLNRMNRKRVVAFLKANQVKVLLVEYLNRAVLLSSAAAEAGVPFFAHAHGYDVSQLGGDFDWRIMYRHLFEAASGIVAPSQFLAAKIAALGCDVGKLSVSPCGVDPTIFQPTSREPLRLIAVGRFTEKKAPQHTITAFAKVVRRYPESQLDFIGDGQLREQCIQLAKDLNVTENIQFLGAQSREAVRTLMGRASLFVQHSVTAENGDTEGLPVSILEAMSSALPIVSTRHSGIPEAVEHGRTGLLVREHDVAGMATAITTLLGDPARARVMGEAGRRRVLENFTHVHAANRLRKIMHYAEQ